jgi:hypothetical protein
MTIQGNKDDKLFMLSTSLVKNTTKKTANNTNLTPTRCRPTADAAHVLAMDPVFPGIYKVQSSEIQQRRGNPNNQLIGFSVYMSNVQ